MKVRTALIQMLANMLIAVNSSPKLKRDLNIETYKEMVMRIREVTLMMATMTSVSRMLRSRTMTASMAMVVEAWEQ